MNMVFLSYRSGGVRKSNRIKTHTGEETLHNKFIVEDIVDSIIMSIE